MNQSYSSDALKTERYFDEESICEQRKVKVYIRTVSRKSIKIELPASIGIDQLKEIILKKFGITYENQVMYLKGTCLNHNMLILLENNWIIHVINLAQVRLPQISIEIKSPTLIKQSSSPSNIKISPKIAVKEFIQDHIVPEYPVATEQILLVQSGRFLKQHLSFVEQNVQNGTTIMLIQSKKQGNSQSSINFPQQSETKTQINQNKKQIQSKDIQYQFGKKEIDSISVKTVEKNDWKDLNLKKSSKALPCKIHDQKPSFRRDYSQKQLLTKQNSSKTLQLSTLTCPHIKNLTIQIGERQCNCKKEKQTFTVSKDPKFITTEDKKRLSKEIRQENLQKLIRMKQKKQEEEKKSPQTQRKLFLNRVKSMQELKVSPLTERKKPGKILANPQKQVKKFNIY